MPLNQPPLRDSREGCQPPPWQQPLKLPIQALCTAGCTAVAGQSSWPSPPSWRDKQQAGAATLSCCSLQHIAPFLAEPASAESPGSLPMGCHSPTHGCTAGQCMKSADGSSSPLHFAEYSVGKGLDC